MPQLINRVPPGLLSLLGIKALGQNPSALADTVDSSIDITGLYLNAFAELVANTTSPFSATGIVGGLNIVPAGEMWIVNSASAYSGAVLGAATTVRARAVLYESVSQRIVRVGQSSTGTTGERLSCGLDGPLVLTSGYQFAVYCESFAGVATTMTMAMLVTKLTV